jgi:hypothetical protein
MICLQEVASRTVTEFGPPLWMNRLIRRTNANAGKPGASFMFLLVRATDFARLGTTDQAWLGRSSDHATPDRTPWSVPFVFTLWWKRPKVVNGQKNY